MALQFEIVQSPLVERMKQLTSRIYSHGMVKIEPSGHVLPAGYQHFAQRIKDFQVRSDDVWVVTYPKCGTTWTQEMVWLIMHDLDFEGAKKVVLEERSPFFEFWGLTIPEEEEKFGTPDTIAQTESVPSPRCIKSHLPMDLLPDQIWTKKPKIIYVTRSAKDVAVSAYYHHQLMNAYKGTLSEFVEMFMAENVVYYDPFWKHILDFWKLKNETHILINSYEEMKKDLPTVVRRTAKFLGKSFSDEQIAQLVDHLDFKNMKQNDSANYRAIITMLQKAFNVTNDFLRSGESGSYRKDLTDEQIAHLDKWSRARVAGTDYPFIG